MNYQLIKDNVRVTLDDECGEGWDGEYNPDDPDDEMLLRFSVDIFDSDVWEPVDNSSYCTQLPATITADDANKALTAIMNEVYSPLQGGYSIKKTCERLSWISKKDLA